MLSFCAFFRVHKGANFSLHCNHASVLNLGVIMTINVKNAVSRQMGGADCLYEATSDVATSGANAVKIERYRYNENTQDLYKYFFNYGCYIFVCKCSKEVYKSKYANQ